MTVARGRPGDPDGKHARLVAALQHEHAGLIPPVDAVQWPEALFRRWFEGGGNLSVAALNEVPQSDVTRRLGTDQVGATLPLLPLGLECLGPGGLLGAIQRADEASISRLVAAISENGLVACDIGTEVASGSALLEEAQRARPRMRPGELRASDGRVLFGLSPSGAPRGDRYICCGELDGGASAWPALAAANEVCLYVWLYTYVHMYVYIYIV